MKNLIVDGQLFQTPAWHRGMGKYSMELLVSLSRHNKKHKTWETMELILSKSIITDQGVVESIKKKLPAFQLTMLDYAPAELDNIESAGRNRTIIEDHITKNFTDGERVDFLVLSLLQSGIAPAFPELPNIHKALLFYDLIPLMFFEMYLTDHTNRYEYTSRLGELLRADTYLAISKTVANDLAWHTGVVHDRIFNINGAPIKHASKTETIKIQKPFILMPTGDDLRKNNERAIRAFSIFNKKNKNKYHLAITSTFTDKERTRLQKTSKEILFTGNITGEQLSYLYKESEALMFPSEYEGLGLPILEAMEYEKPILCSDISVFREISDSLFEFFDYKDISSIEKSLHQLAANKVKPNKEAYKKVLDRYTWDNTAKDAAKALSRTYVKTNCLVDATVFTPNPTQTFVGRHVQLLHGELQKKIHLQYRYESNDSKREQRINHTAYAVHNNEMIDGSSRINIAAGSTPIYHLSDERCCAKILFTALANPGIVVLYSNTLSLVWGTMQKAGLIGTERVDAELGLSRLIGVKEESFLVSLVAFQKGIIVHNKTLYSELKNIAEKIENSKISIKYVRMPAVETVYPEVLPKNRKFDKIIIKDKQCITEETYDCTEAKVIDNSSDGLFEVDTNVSITDHDLHEILIDSKGIDIRDNIFLEAESSSLGCPTLPSGMKHDNLDPESVKEMMLRSRKQRKYTTLANQIKELIEEVNHE